MELPTKFFHRWFLPTNIIPSLSLSVYTDRPFSSAIRSVYTKGRVLSVYTDCIANKLYRFLKSCNGVMTWIFFRWFYRRNDRGIQIRISVPWCGTVTGGLTDRTCPSVIPSVKANIYPLCRLSLPLFPLLLPLPNYNQPPIPILPLFSTQALKFLILCTWSQHQFFEQFIVDFIIFCK
jgi:hypothetical protein